MVQNAALRVTCFLNDHFSCPQNSIFNLKAPEKKPDSIKGTKIRQLTLSLLRLLNVLFDKIFNVCLTILRTPGVIKLKLLRLVFPVYGN